MWIILIMFLVSCSDGIGDQELNEIENIDYVYIEEKPKEVVEQPKYIDYCKKSNPDLNGCYWKKDSKKNAPMPAPGLQRAVR